MFKGGDVYNTNDYRGISITSCLDNIFIKTLNTRLQIKFKTDKKLLNNQAAYRSDYSTTDQIFILKSLLNKYIASYIIVIGVRVYGFTGHLPPVIFM